MGGTAEQGGSPYDDELPTHSVTLDDYNIGQVEVTQELWEAVMGSNPSSYTGDLNRPVEKVSWNQAQQFVSKLSALTGENFSMWPKSMVAFVGIPILWAAR